MLLIVHQEKYTIQKLNLLKTMMISDCILTFFVSSHVPVSFCICCNYFIRILCNLLLSGNHFEQGTFCASECQVDFEPVGHVCEPFPNGVCVGGSSELHDVTYSYLLCIIQFVEA